MKGDRVVAGLWCHEVLARLSDYLDEELAPAERGEVEAHLRGCDSCARFGGALGTTVRALRAHLRAAADDAPPGLRDRLRERLDREGGG